MKAMYQWRLLKLLLLPSAMSTLAVLMLSAAFLGYFAWQYIQDNQFFYDYLFGAYGFQSYMWSRSSSVGTASWGGEAVYFVLLCTIAIAIGCSIYAVLEGIARFRRQVTTVFAGEAITAPQRESLIAEFVTRSCLRIMGILGWGLYTLFFVGVVVQFALLLAELSVQRLQAADGLGVAYGVLATLVLAIALHIHVLFARLCLLRPRLFGGEHTAGEAKATPAGIVG